MENQEVIAEQDVYVCRNCGQTFFVETEVDNVCDDCIECYSRCDDCGDWTHNDNITYVDDRPICESCYADHYDVCECCENTTHCDDLHTVHIRVNYLTREAPREAQWCGTCCDTSAFRCDDCNEMYDNDLSLITTGGDCICEDCYEENFFTCENCHEILRNDQHCDDGRCYECCENRQGAESIHSYHHGARIYHHDVPGEKRDPLKIGVELEMEGGRDIADDFVEEYSESETLFYLENDGSLNDGMEMISQPCSLSFHEKIFPWNDALEYLRAHGCKSHNTTTCGLHVHVSKAFLSQTDQIKIGLFCGFNADKLEILGRRKYNGYSSQKNIQDKRHANKNESGSRYEAVNFLPYKTVEFRFFRGTLKRDTLMAAIQFAHAICHFVKQNNFPTMVKPCWNKFTAYVQSDKRYKTLVAYLIHKDLMKGGM